MVVIGNYSVRLVNAETKEPFKEHKGPDGLVYAEVEPDIEYFVECEIVGGDPTAVNLAELDIDGKPMDYFTCVSRLSGKKLIGNPSYENGIQTTRAFKFQCPEFQKAEGDLMQTPHAALMGTITLEFWSAIFEGMRKAENYSAESITVEPVSNTAGLTKEEGKRKVLRTGEGKHTHTTIYDSTECPDFSYGECLEQITIKYCTALGLLRVGVLARTDIWTELRMAKPWKRENDESEIIIVEPKRIKVGQVVEDGGVELGLPQKEVEFFDLTFLPDDDKKKIESS